MASATVFVPDAAATHFLKKIEQYATENAKPPEPKADAAVVGTDSQPGKSKHEQLIARIQTVALAPLVGGLDSRRMY